MLEPLQRHEQYCIQLTETLENNKYISDKIDTDCLSIFQFSNKGSYIVSLEGKIAPEIMGFEEDNLKSLLGILDSINILHTDVIADLLGNFHIFLYFNEDHEIIIHQLNIPKS